MLLAGHRLVRFEAPRLLGRPPRPGTTVQAVEARGKHLLVHFSDGRALHTHLRMTGSWHIYRGGEPWRRPHARVSVVLEVEDGTMAVCFAAPTVELVDPGRTLRRTVLDTLGPDLCQPDVDLEEVARRLGRLDPATEIGVALLDQRVAAGIGNVYKSEVCFACRVEPGRRLADVDDATRRALFQTAAALLHWPAYAEAGRSATGRITGALIGLLTTIKGLPSSYQRDLQEDKEALFAAHDQIDDMLLVAVRAILATQFREDRLLAAASNPLLLATEAADYLVHKGVPFRQAHDLVGKVLREAEKQGKCWTQLSLADMRKISPHFEADFLDGHSVENAIATKIVPGGTATESVRAAIAILQNRLHQLITPKGATP